MIKQIKHKIIVEKSKIISLLDQAIVSGGNFLIGILLVRQLGLLTYGEFTLIWLIVLFCSSIHQGWIINPMYTFAPQYKKEEKQDYINSLFFHQLIFASFSAFCSWLFIFLATSYFPKYQISNINLIVPIMVFSFLMYDFIRKINFALEQPAKSFVLDIAVYATQFIGLFFMSTDLYSTVLIISMSYGVSILFGLNNLFSISIRLPHFKTIAKKHWKFSKWIIGTSLLQWMSGNFFIIASASLLSPVAVGAIRILQNIVGVLHILFLAIENYIPIRAVKIFKADGLSALGTFLKKIMWQGSIITLSLGIIIAFFGKTIIGSLYQGEYTDYAYLLYGFAFLYVLVFIGINLRFVFRTIESTQPIFIAYIISAIFSLGFANTIIHNFGIQGVIIGLIANQLIIQSYFIFSLKKQSKELWR